MTTLSVLDASADGTRWSVRRLAKSQIRTASTSPVADRDASAEVRTDAADHQPSADGWEDCALRKRYRCLRRRSCRCR